MAIEQPPIPTLDLILWRHADAQDGAPDLSRDLTAKGHKQARLMADWLTPRLPEKTRFLVSPAVRARHTGDALGRDYEVAPGLAPGMDVAHILAACGWPDARGAVLVVGHQPTLGALASLLLFGEERSLALKKGALLWLTNRTRGGAIETVIRAAVTPEMI